MNRDGGNIQRNVLEGIFFVDEDIVSSLMKDVDKSVIVDESL